MMNKCVQCGEQKVDALQRAGGVSGTDYLVTRCYGCGREEILHGERAKDTAAEIDAGNQQPTEKAG